MQIRTWLAASSLGLALVGLGCGDDDGGGSVSSSKELGELTEAEAKSLCEEAGRAALRVERAYIEVTCTAVSIGQTTCDDLREECIEEATSELEESDCSTPEEDGLVAGCPDITVGDARGCVNALVEYVEELADTLTCDIEEGPESPEVPEECSRLANDCPDLADPFAE